MSLVPISQNQIALKNLSPDEVAAIEAGKGIRIKDYGIKDLFSRVAHIVRDCVIIRGEKNLTEHDQGRITKEFTDELKDTFSTFTVEEVQQACRAWALGKIYEEGKHISVHNLCKSVWSWRDAVKREAIHKINKEEEQKEKEISEEKKKELTELFKADLLNTWKDFKEKRQLNPVEEYYHAAMYEHLEKHGYALNSEIKKTIWEECKPEKKKEHIPSTQIHDFLRGQELEQKQRAKAAALKYVFDWLINNDKELEL